MTLRTYGTDRLVIDGDRFLLSTRLPKGWKARIERTLTSAEFPGTAVLWEEEYYEVVEIAPIGDTGGVRYCLMLWRDEHAIRTADRYDEAAEEHRHAEHRAAIRHQKNRFRANLFSVILGQTPAVVQTRLSYELGINEVRMTLLSTIPAFLAFIALGQQVVGSIINGTPSGIPLWVHFLVIGLFAETVIRVMIAWTQNRPVGSFFGILGYILYYYLFARNRAATPSPFDKEKGKALIWTEPPPDVAIIEDLETKAPFFTLLSAEEQRRLAQRYGYDYRANARVIAGIIFTGAVCGVITSIRSLSMHPGFGPFVSLVVAGYLTIEQLVRFMAFGRGPSGSALAFLVRPLARKYLG
ncbi:MAG TPA: hypothetical protein VMU84_08025 [Thermoanaerobaculia bacterium]|nr:hypothetical protein [Thermoanaerobaculia bacterium]